MCDLLEIGSLQTQTVRVRSHWGEGVLSPAWSESSKEEDAKARGGRGHTCGNRGKDAAPSLEAPGTNSCLQEPEEQRTRPWASEGAGPCWQLGSRLLASRTVRDEALLSSDTQSVVLCYNRCRNRVIITWLHLQESCKCRLKRTGCSIFYPSRSCPASFLIGKIHFW